MFINSDEVHVYRYNSLKIDYPMGMPFLYSYQIRWLIKLFVVCANHKRQQL